ncbi:MAG TPA: DUF3710 domain-containing protein [Actinomycetes bacterium]|nr:DUF3710 domain-containing protein [Actinomycetes bacterium]
MFRRRRREDDPAETTAAEGAEDGAVEADDAADDLEDIDDERGSEAGSTPRSTPSAGRENGPWDVSEVDDPAAGGRVDLGGMWLPGRPGLEVRVEADQATSQVVAVTLVLGRSALQLQPFAAPKTEDIWDEVRGEIRAGITKQGGTADEVDGPLGTELRTKVPVRAADGSSSVQPARFVGVSGPRWFLRGVLTGQAAVEEGADTELVELFREVVVVRGFDPMAPREPIPLRLPAATLAAEAEAEARGEGGDDGDGDGDDKATRADDLNPFERGPEITEIR